MTSLNGKNALVFAATGAISSAVARRLALAGANVFISGRNEDALSEMTNDTEISWSRVDATNNGEVEKYIEKIVTDAGSVDIVFNGIGVRAAEGAYATSSQELLLEKFLLPLEVIVGSQFLTARTAARHMAHRGQGSIVLLSAGLSWQIIPFMAGITAACGAIDALTRTLAAEFGASGIRVNCVRAHGIPETRTIRESTAQMAKTMGVEQSQAEQPAASNALGRAIHIGELAETVAFLASDEASGISAQVVNVCAGTLVS